MENSKKLKDQIKKAIEDNKIDLALEHLAKLYDNHSDKNIVIQLKAQHRKLQDDLLSGIISRPEENIEINEIRSKIIALVDRFKTEIQPNLSNTEINKKTATGNIEATNVHIGDNIYSSNGKDTTEKKEKWYQKNTSIFKIIISLCGLFVAVVILLFGNNLLGRFSNSVLNNKKPKVESPDEYLIPFVSNDSILNILIIKFENVSNENETKCIGSSLERRINDLRDNKNLRVNAIYCDEILSPTNQDQAIEIRKKYNADLLVYGYANVKEICTADVEFCFNFTFADTIRNILPHPKDINFQKFENFEELFTGKLSIDGKSLEAWLLTYIALKDRDLYQAIEQFKYVMKGKSQINECGIKSLILDISIDDLYLQVAAFNTNFFIPNNLKKGEKYCIKLLKMNPKNTIARDLLAQNYDKQQDCEKERLHLDTLISIKNRYIDDEECIRDDDYLDLAFANKDCGYYVDAINNFTKVIDFMYMHDPCDCENSMYMPVSNNLESWTIQKIDPNIVNAHINRGECHALLGDKKLANNDFKEAILLDNTKSEIINQLTEKYHFL